MACEDEELASISALMMDQFTTYNMTGWIPRCGSDEFNTLTLLRRDGRFILRVTNEQQEVAEIALDDVISYVIRVPTWHEVKQGDSSLIAFNLSKSSNFDQFYDLLVSALKILKKYDRLADRVGADEQTFLDELKIVCVRIKQMSLGVQPTGGIRRPCVTPAISSRRPPPPPPPRSKRPGLAPQKDTQIDAKKPTSIPQSEQMELQSDDDEYYVVLPSHILSSWVCPRCTLINKPKTYQCSACELRRTDAWLCRRCSNMQHIELRKCVKCKMLRCRRCDYHNDPGTKKCAICNSHL